MTPEQLSDVFVAALTDLVSEGAVVLPDGVPSQVLVERPKVKEHGDYATNVALQLGKRAGLNPRELATMLAERLTEHPGVASVMGGGPSIPASGSLSESWPRTVSPSLAGVRCGCFAAYCGRSTGVVIK